MKRLKIFLLALLIAVMAISLMGCKKKNPEEIQPPVENVTEALDPVVEESPVEPLEEMDENVLMPEASIL